MIVDTTDRDVAADALGRSFPGLDLARNRDGLPFRFFHSRDTRGIITYSRMRVRGAIRTSGVYPDEFAVARRLAGTVALEYGTHQVDTAVAYLRPPGQSDARFEDSSAELISVDPDAFRRLAARHLEGSGRRVRRPDAASAVPSTPGARLWAAAAEAVSSDDGSSVLHARVLEDLVVSTVLWAFPVTDDVGTSAGAGVLPRAVRRATAYIDEHLAEPISVIDVADAALVSVRTLQTDFIRHLATTPSRYIHEARLREAHDELRASTSERTTVAAIARTWGFTNPGRFASDYRQRYGQNPSRTLRH